MPYTLQDEVVFCAGNFWEAQPHFARLAGVISTRVGYAGGSTSHPSYHEVGDHMEAIHVVYDQRLISFTDLLAAYLQLVDGEVADRRHAYSILCASQDQQAQARLYIRDNERHTNVHIGIESLGRFWPAEDYHQNYLAKLRGDT